MSTSPTRTDASLAGTDPTGRLFVSYRRSRLLEISALVPRLHEHGIPTWQDRRNLDSEPTIEAIREALADPTTAGAIVWLSTDVAKSQVILQEEAPRILKRARAQDGFAAKFCLADGLAFEDAGRILKMPGSLEDPSKSWNLRQIEGNPATDASLTAVTHAALQRRLRLIHKALPPEAPLPVAIHAHAQARPAFQTGLALTVDWTSHFQHRHAASDAWSGRLLPALNAIVDSIRTSAPGRAVVAQGHISLASAFALGRAFMEPSGLSLTWKQLPKGDLWTLGSSSSEQLLTAQLSSHDVSATDLAVLVSMRGDVEPAVVASSLPAFRAVLRISPRGGGPNVQIETSTQASEVARLVGERLRDARHEYPAVRKTHIFYSGPAGIAMMIGQQLNAVGPVQLYEHTQTPEDAVGKYMPAALLCDTPACA